MCIPPFVFLPCLWPLKKQVSCGGYKPPFVSTALCVYRLDCGPLDNKTPGVATDRFLCAALCVYTAFCVHQFLCVLPCPWPLK